MPVQLRGSIQRMSMVWVDQILAIDVQFIMPVRQTRMMALLDHNYYITMPNVSMQTPQMHLNQKSY